MYKLMKSSFLATLSVVVAQQKCDEEAREDIEGNLVGYTGDGE